MKDNKSFLVGILGGFMGLATIGFFVMLAVFLLRGDDTRANNRGTAENNIANKPSQPVANQPAGNAEIVFAPVTADDYVRGNKNAKITIVEYSDTECPFCKRFHATMQQVMENYGDSVRWVYRNAPLDGLHQKARKEAEALECAGDLGGNEGFWKFTDRLYEITPSNDGLQPSQLPEIAKYVGLNESKFNECLESGKFSQKVQADLADAERAGMRGTPYSVIISGDKKIPLSGAYPYAQVAGILDSLK